MEDYVQVQQLLVKYEKWVQHMQSMQEQTEWLRDKVLAFRVKVAMFQASKEKKWLLLYRSRLERAQAHYEALLGVMCNITGLESGDDTMRRLGEVAMVLSQSKDMLDAWYQMMTLHNFFTIAQVDMPLPDDQLTSMLEQLDNQARLCHSTVTVMKTLVPDDMLQRMEGAI